MSHLNLKSDRRSDKGSVASQNASVSTKSSNSSLSSIIARKRAKAQAEKAKLQYVQRVSQKEAELALIKQEQEVAAAEAELEALVMYNDVAGSLLTVDVVSSSKSARDHDRNVEEFVRDQSKYFPRTEPGLNVNAETFVPTHVDNHNITNNDVSPVSDLTKFLLKKDLMLASLVKFNDQPQSFPCWKTGFKTVVRDLNVTPSEEIDLLIKWLGPESASQALSIKVSNVVNPVIGLRRIWERLDERYGSPEMIELALKTKLDNFPRITNKNIVKLYELHDILSEIESIKQNESYGSILSYYDSSSTVKLIVDKLPYNLQEKWITRAAKYKQDFRVSFPPFTVLVDFIKEMSRIRNDPSFSLNTYGSTCNRNAQPLENPRFMQKPRQEVTARKTEIEVPLIGNQSNLKKYCPFHKRDHGFNECRGFRTKSITERKQFVKNNVNAVISDKSEPIQQSQIGETLQGGETKIKSTCTEICGNSIRYSGKSCAKLVKVDIFHKGDLDNVIKAYAILDDQSNCSLGCSELFDQLGLNGNYFTYTLTSCSGKFETQGRQAKSCVIRHEDGKTELEIPILIECNSIPDIRDEIPTPEIARQYAHLKDIADFIPQIDNDRDILILIGRDIPQAHHVLDQRIGPMMDSPYAQKLTLGWVIIGETCLDKVHNVSHVNANKIALNVRQSDTLFTPCENILIHSEPSVSDECNDKSIFTKTSHDDKVGLSIEDKEFLEVMDKGFRKGTFGNWIAPLPFRSSRPVLPNNKVQAIRRANLLDTSLRKNPLKQEHMLNFMKGILDNHHASTAPPLEPHVEQWYLPIFGVYHPKKPGKIRGVFDSSAKFEGISLNDVLLTGPNLTNDLLGILLRFRKEPVAVICDIEQMFYNFYVQEDHRRYLRFLWYENNDMNNPLIDYQMDVHVFGNRPSPAVANYGLHKIAQISEHEFGPDVKRFIEENFYVDDGLVSVKHAADAVNLIKKTQKALLSGGNVRLHKIASNSIEVMQAFPAEDLAKDMKDIGSNTEDTLIQQSLGLSWNLQSDSFTFRVSNDLRPFTRRGVLSTVNSLYDPIGFVAPVTINGKILLREMTSETLDWDEEIPNDKLQEWEIWRNSLKILEHRNISRTYAPCSLSSCISKDLYIYSDASELAIAAAAYMVVKLANNELHTSFVLGKAKVAPKSGHTMPRLELCAAVLACEIKDIILDNFKEDFSKIKFHCDSKVVLGYINNRKRRFYTYVTNRVERILRSSEAAQWFYVSSDKNPADSATRLSGDLEHKVDKWLQGPTVVLNNEDEHERFPLFEPDNDSEIRKEVEIFQTNTPRKELLRSRYIEKFSSWFHLVSAVGQLKRFAKAIKNKNKQCLGTHLSTEERQQTELFLLKNAQREVYRKEITSLESEKVVENKSPIVTLNPFLDDNGILRVGGRLGRSSLSFDHKHPIIIPKRHHIATLLVRKYHQKVNHQGRHFTEGSLRSAGLWIVGCKNLVSSVIKDCVNCRKFRGSTVTQIMSDLPEDRQTPSPPFTCVGVDTFGPWTIVTRRTRGAVINNKRWAVLFTCLSSRAIHIEVVESLSSDAFINALRRFIAIRGPVKQFRSDQGTNFVGATTDLGIKSVNVEDGPIKNFLDSHQTTWLFNAPHSSHMGGSWERMIGVTRRILDQVLSDVHANNLTHDVLVTLMAEIVGIVNARPLVPLSSDPDLPEVLSPNMLLTQKTEPMVSPPMDSVNLKVQWQQVQKLADLFWSRWRTEYLQNLQHRRKWQYPERDLKEGDIVLLKDKQLSRGEWPTGIIMKTYPSVDGKVRKVLVRVVKDGKGLEYVRPISEVILLVHHTDTEC